MWTQTKEYCRGCICKLISWQPKNLLHGYIASLHNLAAQSEGGPKLNFRYNTLLIPCQQQFVDLYKQIIVVTGHSEEVTITFSYLSLTIKLLEMGELSSTWYEQCRCMMCFLKKLFAFHTRNVGLCIYYTFTSVSSLPWLHTFGIPSLHFFHFTFFFSCVSMLMSVTVRPKHHKNISFKSRT